MFYVLLYRIYHWTMLGYPFGHLWRCTCFSVIYRPFRSGSRLVYLGIISIYVGLGVWLMRRILVVFRPFSLLTGFSRHLLAEGLRHRLTGIQLGGHAFDIALVGWF